MSYRDLPPTALLMVFGKVLHICLGLSHKGSCYVTYNNVILGIERDEELEEAGILDKLTSYDIEDLVAEIERSGMIERNDKGYFTVEKRFVNLAFCVANATTSMLAKGGAKK